MGQPLLFASNKTSTAKPYKTTNARSRREKSKLEQSIADC